MACSISGLRVHITGERSSQPQGTFGCKFIEYQVQLMAAQDVFTSFKRYRDFLALKNKQGAELTSRLPDFPNKCVFKTQACLASRKNKLEAWLKAFLKEDPAQLMEFLGVPVARIDFLLQFSRNPELTEGDRLVADLLTRLHTECRLKCRSLEIFDCEYFKKVRPLHQQYIKLLVITLVSLSPCEVVGIKALDLLLKLASCTHSRQHADFIEVLLKLDLLHLQKLRLECHIRRTMHGGSCAQGLQLLKLLDLKYGADDEWLLSVLNGDREALAEYKNWSEGSLSVCQLRTIESSCEWTFLDCSEYPGNLVFKFRFVERLLELEVCQEIEAPLERIIDLIYTPEKRAEWDRVICDYKILEVHSEYSRLTHFKLIRDGCTLPVILQTEVLHNRNSVQIRGTSLEDSEAVRRGYEPGHNVYFLYLIEPLRHEARRSQSVGQEEDCSQGTTQSYQMSFSIQFCVHLSKHFLPLVHGEDSILMRNMVRLKAAAEGTHSCQFQTNDSLAAVLERKLPDLNRRKHKTHSYSVALK